MVIVPKSTLRKHHTNRFKNAEDAVTDRNNWFSGGSRCQICRQYPIKPSFWRFSLVKTT